MITKSQEDGVRQQIEMLLTDLQLNSQLLDDDMESEEVIIDEHLNTIKEILCQ